MLLPLNTCGVCADCVTPVPVTASVTGLSCPLPPAFLWQGVQYTTSTFIQAVQAQVSGAVYSGATCQFTAPEKSVFPALVVTAVPSPVTASVTGLPAPLVAPLVWAGIVYPSVAAFVTAVQAQVIGATYNPATAVFTAPPGSIFPALVVSAPPVAVLPGCPTPFPVVWAGTIYTSASALDTAIQTALDIQVQYSPSTCTFTQTSGPVTPQFPLAGVTSAPSAALTPCPIVLPTVFQGVAYNNIGTLQAGIEAYYSVTLAYNSAACKFTQTGGSGTLGAVALAAAPTITPTGSGAACPLVYPVTYNSTDYTTLPALKAAVEASLGVTTSYNSTSCLFQILTGPVTPAPSAVFTAVVIPAPVTAAVTGRPCPLAAPFDWQGVTYNSVGAFITDVRNQVAGATYNASTCVFTAPAGSVFPALVLQTTAAPAAPVTAAVTGRPCPLAAPFDWQGSTYNSVSAFITDVRNQVAGATYNASTCVFTAPAGSVFPALVLQATAVVPPPAVNMGTLSSCPMVFPAYFSGVACANIVQLKQTIEALYSVVTVYDTTTCTFTKVGGAGMLPAAITVESGCLNTLSANTWNDNAGNPVFRRVTGPVPAGFINLLNNSGGQVTIISSTIQTKCGITYNVPFVDNAGTIIGYGATL